MEEILIWWWPWKPSSFSWPYWNSSLRVICSWTAKSWITLNEGIRTWCVPSTGHLSFLTCDRWLTEVSSWIHTLHGRKKLSGAPTNSQAVYSKCTDISTVTDKRIITLAGWLFTVEITQPAQSRSMLFLYFCSTLFKEIKIWKNY